MGGADEIATARPFLAKDGDYQLPIERMNITDMDVVLFAVVAVGETINPPLLDGVALAKPRPVREAWFLRVGFLSIG
jgi:hypothetical protein